MDLSEFCDFLERVEAEPSRNAMVGILSELFHKIGPQEARAVTYLLQGVVEPPFKGVEFGIGEKLLIRAISMAYGQGKKAVLSEYRKSGDLGLVAESLLSKGKKQVRLAEDLLPLTVGKAYSELRRLALQAGTGSQDQKISTLASLFGRCRTPAEAKHLARIPLAKLRLGVGDPTILDALSTRFSGDKSMREDLEAAYNLCSDLGRISEIMFSEGEAGLSKVEISPGNPIRPALAERLNSGAEIIERMGPCLVEAKYDGFRVQIHKDGAKIEIFSRSLERTTDMFPEITRAVRDLPFDQMIFEGEALAYDKERGAFLPFQETIQRKRKHDVAGMSERYPLRLFAFDLLFLEGVDYTALLFEERRRKLEKIFALSPGISPSVALRAKTGEEVDEFFLSCVGKGLEGIIAKDPKAKYAAGARKFAWIKMKKSYTEAGLADTIDAVIIGYFRGKGQRTDFGFGGLLVAVLDEESGRYVSVAKVGSGFSEEEMAAFPQLLKEDRSAKKPPSVESGLEPDFWVLPRKVVTIAADEITRSPTHAAGASGGQPGFALRFPRIKGGVRGDKKPADATTVAEIRELFRLQDEKRTAVAPGRERDGKDKPGRRKKPK